MRDSAPILTSAEITANASTGRRTPVSTRFMTHVMLLAVCVFAIAPSAWMFSTSLKTADKSVAYPPQILPNPVVPKNYWDVVSTGHTGFLLWARNSMIVAVLTVAGTTISSAVVAYGFAKIPFRGRDTLFIIMLATMMIPFPVTMVPLFSMFRWLADLTRMQWIGTFKPLWFPAWFGSAFSIFLLRQFFLTIPNDFSEAARIDGCSEVGIFLRVILPLARPALAVVALFSFMAAWNDFLAPLVYLQRPEQFTLALGLENFQSRSGGTEWPQLMAASVLVISPVIVLFFLAQRTFIQGIATTGIKG
jgi:multiple sugar transport system permease protein